MSGYSEGDSVYFCIGEGVKVGHIVSADDADWLNRGEIPPRWGGSEGDTVERTSDELHFFPECGGEERKHLSWGQADTTCEACNLKHANELRGWRWAHQYNAEVVAWLTSRLGAERLAPIVSQPAVDEPPARWAAEVAP